jgi:hypothetical protein
MQPMPPSGALFRLQAPFRIGGFPMHGMFLAAERRGIPPKGQAEKIAGIFGGSFSSAHGATEYGAIFRPRRSNMIGPICPPNSVTKASTRSDAIRQDG